MAVAGFSKDDRDDHSEQPVVDPRGASQQERADLPAPGHPQRTLQRVFNLADYVVVADASLNEGLLDY